MSRLLAHHRRWVWVFAAAVLLILPVFSQAQGTVSTNGTALGPINFNIGLANGDQPQKTDAAIQVLFTLTLLTLAPSIMLLMTSFTRIVIVLSFIRSALSLQGAPANQIIIGLSMFMTFFIMAPVWENVQKDAIVPYKSQQISGDEALEKASFHIRSFMLKQARPKDVELFAAMARLGPTAAADLPLRVVVPGFIISELRTAFQMGFLLFVPFILIDLVVATVLMSMGMMMMPPMTISLPLKILLFVLVDGWGLIVRSLVRVLVSDRAMTPEFAIELLRVTMFHAVALAAPFLVTAMLIGLVISLFQAVTSINEQTLSFVPKALVVVGVLVVLLPWMLRKVMEFTIAIIEKIPQMAQ